MRITLISSLFVFIIMGCIKQDTIRYIKVDNKNVYNEVKFMDDSVATSYNPANEYRDTFKWTGSYLDGDTVILLKEYLVEHYTIAIPYKVTDSFLYEIENLDLNYMEE